MSNRPFPDYAQGKVLDYLTDEVVNKRTWRGIK